MTETSEDDNRLPYFYVVWYINLISSKMDLRSPEIVHQQNLSLRDKIRPQQVKNFIEEITSVFRTFGLPDEVKNFTNLLVQSNLERFRYEIVSNPHFILTNQKEVFPTPDAMYRTALATFLFQILHPRVLFKLMRAGEDFRHLIFDLILHLHGDYIELFASTILTTICRWFRPCKDFSSKEDYLTRLVFNFSHSDLEKIFFLFSFYLHDGNAIDSDLDPVQSPHHNTNWTKLFKPQHVEMMITALSPSMVDVIRLLKPFVGYFGGAQHFDAGSIFQNFLEHNEHFLTQKLYLEHFYWSVESFFSHTILDPTSKTAEFLLGIAFKILGKIQSDEHLSFDFSHSLLHLMAQSLEDSDKFLLELFRSDYYQEETFMEQTLVNEAERLERSALAVRKLCIFADHAVDAGCDQIFTWGQQETFLKTAQIFFQPDIYWKLQLFFYDRVLK